MARRRGDRLTPGRPANEVYRDLRAGAASGWDYSSRWLRDITRLASIRTTQFIPIDLNAFLFKLETTIANLSGLKGDRETETAFRQKAQDRRAAVNRYLWDDENGCFRDYDWRREQLALFSQPVSSPLRRPGDPRTGRTPCRCGAGPPAHPGDHGHRIRKR